MPVVDHTTNTARRVYVPRCHQSGTLLGTTRVYGFGDRSPLREMVVDLDDGRVAIVRPDEIADGGNGVLFPAPLPPSDCEG